MFTLAIRSRQRAALLLLTLVPAARLGAQSTNSRVDAVFAAYDKPDSPGCAVAVSDGGKTVFAKGYGMASLEHDVPITPVSAFYAASVSKQFTAFAVALLATQGKLSLDDDVRRWIPEVPDFGKKITIQHLIHHTSGLRDYFGLLGMTDWPSDGPLTEAQFLDLVHRQKSLNFDPGTRFLYSNTGYVLLSIVVKRASGQSLREFADAQIFAPLGMTNSHFRDDHTALIKNRALAYAPRRAAGTPASASPSGWQLDMPGFDVIGDGGLFTTVEDLAKWARNSDDHTVGGNNVAALVLTRGHLNSGDSIPYAFGLTLGAYRGLAMIDHGGAYGGYRTEVLRFPAQHLAVLTLCNTATANSAALSLEVAAVYLGDRLAPVATPSQTGAPSGAPPVSIPGDRLARYAGAYWDARDEALLQLEMRDGGLAIKGTRVTLVAVAEGSFRPSPSPSDPSTGRPLSMVYAFGTDKTGATTLEISGSSPTVERRQLRAMPVPRTDPKTLAGYEGDYYSDELDVTWHIAIENGNAVIRRRAVRDQALQAAFNDAFTSPFGVVRFTRDGSGRVTGFIVGAGRVTGFKFTRATA